MENIFKYPAQTKSLISERRNNALLAVRDMPEAEAKKTDALINRAAAALDTLISSTITTQANGQLSPTYCAELTEGFKENFIDEILATERSAERFAADAEKVLDAAQLPAVDTAFQQSRFAEIRQLLAGEDEAQLSKRYQKDILAGNYTELVAALEDSPLPHDFVTDTTRHKSRLNRVGAVAPEAVASYHATLKGSQVARQFTGSIAGLVTGAGNGGFCGFG